ncbi:MAG: tRNA (cytidine(34)-2'-O)-methyltransferase [bacterium]|nr:tRNA (cytidine(34)-2'-O)-methyltransferase [bacterium]
MPLPSLPDPPLHLVLITPEIPPNTGNVARTCAVTGCRLHLVEPLGFTLTDRELRRAGLDYWDSLGVQVWPALEAYLTGTAEARRWYCSTKGSLRHDEAPYAWGDHLVFGPETKGLPADLLATAPDSVIRIPMRPDQRSLNLSNAVAVVTYAALQQLDFPGMT